MLCKHEVVGSIPSASTNSFAVVGIFLASIAGAHIRGLRLSDQLVRDAVASCWDKYWNKVIGSEAQPRQGRLAARRLRNLQRSGKQTESSRRKRDTAEAVSEGFGLCVLFDIVKRK